MKNNNQNEDTAREVWLRKDLRKTYSRMYQKMSILDFLRRKIYENKDKYGK